MTFTAKYHGECGFCGEDLKDTEADYGADKVLVHTKCLIPYSTGVDPGAMTGRNEKMCADCFTVHAGECA